MDIEDKIAERGLTAPRVTQKRIEEVVVDVAFHVFPGSQLTVCCLTLENGFSVVGESACASPENFDAELGMNLAYVKALDKVWMLEGYLLKERLHRAKVGVAPE